MITPRCVHRSHRHLLLLFAALANVAVSACTFDKPFPAQARLSRAIATEGGLRAGVGVEDITPPPGCEMGGFSIFRDATAVRDPLFVRAVVLERGDVRVALVAFDLLGLQGGELTKIRPHHPGVPDDQILVHCTHNHQGPDTLGFWGTPPFTSGIDRAYHDRVRVAANQALRTAYSRLAPAEVAAVEVSVEPDELVKNLRRPGVVDRGLWVLHFRERDGGATIATLCGFGAHPEALGSKNTLISADYPGELLAEVESRIGGRAVFFSGALGAMATPVALQGETPEQSMVRVGRTLGGLVADAASAFAPADYEAAPRLELHTTDVFCEAANWRYRFARAIGLLERDLFDGYLRAEVGLLRIADATFVTVPGELPPDVGLALLAKLPGRVHGVLGLTEDQLGYLLPPGDYELPLFRYEKTFSPGPGIVPAIERAIERLRFGARAVAAPRAANGDQP